MEESLPAISEVFIESLDYLSKLGKNLSLRTESVKKKKIARNKLQNLHNVEKVANKILHICDLAKKSIENVETSVLETRNLYVNNHMKDSVSTVESKENTFENNTFTLNKNNEPHNHCNKIAYEGRDLKITSDIPLKHYQSCHVLSSKLDPVELNRYPVYSNDDFIIQDSKNINHICDKSFKSQPNNNKENPDECTKFISHCKNHDESHVSDKCHVKKVKIKDLSKKINVSLTKNRCLSDIDNLNGVNHQVVNENLKKVGFEVESEDELANDISCNSNDDVLSSVDSSIRKLNESLAHSPALQDINNPLSNIENEIEKNHQKKSNDDGLSILTIGDSVNSKEKKSKKLQKRIKHSSSEDETFDNANHKICDNNFEKSDENCNIDRESSKEKASLIKHDHITGEISVTKRQNEVDISSSPQLKCSEINFSNSITADDTEFNERIASNNVQRLQLDENIINSSSPSIDMSSNDKAKDLEEITVGDLEREKKSDEVNNKCLDQPIKENDIGNKKASSNVKKQIIGSDIELNKDMESVLDDQTLELSGKHNNVSENNSLENDQKNQTENAQESIPTEKPLFRIKCVDITKLINPKLKSEVPKGISKPIICKSEQKNKFTKITTILSSDDDEPTHKKLIKSMQKKMNNEKYGDCKKKSSEDTERKRVERLSLRIGGKYDCTSTKESVAKFKPKKFTIELSNLPKFSRTFLEKYKLKIIRDHRGHIIYPKHHKVPRELIHKVKNELLDDSSSETSNNNVKKKLLSSSDDGRKDEAKRKLLEPSEDEEKNQNAEVKKKLLDSSEEENPTNKQKKRKHQRKELIQAKKALIESSSSSETDDELLRKALKKIRRSIEREMDDLKKSNKLSKKCEEKNNSNSSSNEEMERSLRLSRRRNGAQGSDSQEGSVKEDAKKSVDASIKSFTNLKSLNKSKASVDEQSASDSSRHSKISKKKPGVPKGNSNKSGDESDRREDDRESLEESSRSEEEMPEEKSNDDEEPMATENGKIGENAKNELLKEDSGDSSGHDDAKSNASADKSSDKESKKSKKKKHGDKKSSKGEKSSRSRKHDPLLHGNLDERDSDKEGKDSSDELEILRKKKVALNSDSDESNKSEKDKKKPASDSENSEDAFKTTKRKATKKESETDDSQSTSDGQVKKKRRRIKRIKDSEEEQSGSDDSDDGGKKTGGRKNIRKVIRKDQLEEATKKAAREERERVARIVERQKVYNNMDFDETKRDQDVVLDKVILDFDPDTKEPLIQVDQGLVKKLKPHQANGIKFMWDACFESVKQIKKGKGSGCILAHCMGLGKTLQVVTLTHTLLTHSELTKVNRVLVVCPLSTVLNWVHEFRMWLEYTDSSEDVNIYELSRYKQNFERAYQLQDWIDCGGVCVLGYEMFRNLSADNPKKFRKKMLKTFQESLVDPGPDMVVCDEGHLLKNEKTSLSQAMNRIKSPRRIVLTGTPLQNNLKEYYCMVQFVKPNLLGKYNEYLNRFVNPITNGQYTDSTDYDIKIMKRRSHVLHKLLDGAVQRRDYGVLAPFLPPKHEYVLFITLTPVQIKLYQYYLDNYSRRQHPDRKSSGFLFPDFQSLQRIWTHPLVLKANSERYEIMQQKKRDQEEEDDSEGSLADFIDDESTSEESTPEESSDDASDCSDGSTKKGKKKKSSKKSKHKAATTRRTRANPEPKDEAKEEPEAVEAKSDNWTEWWVPLVAEDELEDMHNSNKLMLLFDILKQCEAIGDKLLVFSQSLYSLDLIEHFLSKVDDATQRGDSEHKLAGHIGSWSPGIDYFRLDGQTSCENRSIWCKNFNKEDNPRARLFLISTRAGGLGINLVAANRVIIFDVSWNPSHDVQSIFRVYRFGQKKPCYIYRFLVMGTMEEKIYERQVTKQAISKRVIDEQQIDRHYAENDLAELYQFTPQQEEPRPVPILPKDRLFAEMLKTHETIIYKYHEHDSLLENKEEETLTEEERKAAWEDFENEKNRPPPPPMINTNFAFNGMGNLMQQNSMAMFTNILRKEYPHLTDQQLASILPSILYQDPTLMQKLLNPALVKYPQQPYMTPNMMNPGPGGVATPGVAYPTWQQQQQYQMQRMQQQQGMQQQGMKYYAGGLGSRDPISMAMQQQRQRELILGAGRGGATAAAGVGRAPPRPAPALSTEVVNLDDSE